MSMASMAGSGVGGTEAKPEVIETTMLHATCYMVFSSPCGEADYARASCARAASFLRLAMLSVMVRMYRVMLSES